MVFLKRAVVGLFSLVVLSTGSSIISASEITKESDSIVTQQAYIPLEVGMSPQHVSAKGTQTNVSKRLTWYDSVSTTYRVTYIDGNGEYQFQGQNFTSYATWTPTVTYQLPTSRTTRTWNDSFSVSGNLGSGYLAGSITLTR